MTDTFALPPDNQLRIMIWEDVWYAKRPIVESRLRALLGGSVRIPARLTRAQRIDKPTADHFLSQNHLQIPTNAKYKYGLFLPQRHFSKIKGQWRSEQPPHESTLVAVASFSGGRNIVRAGQTYRSYELIRFCNLLNCTVIGGLDKLLKTFVEEIQPDDLMTYADRDWSEGASYQKLGFERIEATDSQQFWVNPHSFERHYADRLSPDHIAPDWIKVQNSGSWKFLRKWK